MDVSCPLFIMNRHGHALQLFAFHMHGEELRFSFWSAAQVAVAEMDPGNRARQCADASPATERSVLISDTTIEFLQIVHVMCAGHAVYLLLGDFPSA